jgi:phosphoribosylformimino-5-aminoimidazole carboxamide ribotide isomerase
MLIPSIDLMGGRIVQLVQGERLKLAFDDFDYWIQRFSSYPLVQLIDLDAAMRQGDNRMLIERISSRLPCQVGGGISTIVRAEEVLRAGAKRVIVGSALFRAPSDDFAGDLAGAVNTEFAAALSRAIGTESIVCGVDTKQGRIAVKGWKQQIRLSPDEAIAQLEPFCAAFLYTHIDSEGTMQGFPLQVAERLRRLTRLQLIVAGGIREMAEVETLHRIGVDAVAGMAVYTGTMPA